MMKVTTPGTLEFNFKTAFGVYLLLKTEGYYLYLAMYGASHTGTAALVGERGSLHRWTRAWERQGRESQGLQLGAEDVDIGGLRRMRTWIKLGSWFKNFTICFSLFLCCSWHNTESW
jgi:hypothetical protein